MSDDEEEEEVIRWPDEGSSFTEPEEPDIPIKELEDAQQERLALDRDVDGLLDTVFSRRLTANDRWHKATEKLSRDKGASADFPAERRFAAAVAAATAQSVLSGASPTPTPVISSYSSEIRVLDGTVDGADQFSPSLSRTMLKILLAHPAFRIARRSTRDLRLSASQLHWRWCASSAAGCDATIYTRRIRDNGGASSVVRACQPSRIPVTAHRVFY